MYRTDASILTVFMITHLAIGAHPLRKNTEDEDRSGGVRGWAHALGVSIPLILHFINDRLQAASSLRTVTNTCSQ